MATDTPKPIKWEIRGTRKAAREYLAKEYVGKDYRAIYHKVNRDTWHVVVIVLERA